jgi:hypothetical protein
MEGRKEGRKKFAVVLSILQLVVVPYFGSIKEGLHGYRNRAPSFVSLAALLHLRYVYKPSPEVECEPVDRTFRYAGAWQWRGREQ